MKIPKGNLTGNEIKSKKKSKTSKHRSWNGCSRKSQICRILLHGTISNGCGVQLRQVESAIQESIVATSPPNAQEVTRR